MIVKIPVPGRTQTPLEVSELETEMWLLADFAGSRHYAALLFCMFYNGAFL